jgi:hypothetical protein
MAYNVLLISEQKLIDNTAMNGSNVDKSELRFCIQQAQTIYLQESLGTHLFDKMLDLVQSGNITQPQNSNYKTLLDDFIQPMLISYSYFIGLDNFFMKWVSIGLVQNRSEQGNNIDLKTLQYMKSQAKDRGEFNDNLLRRQLVFNSQLYPEYLEWLNNGSLPPEQSSGFRSPITLPGYGWYWVNGQTSISEIQYVFGNATNSPGAHAG